MSDSTKTPHRYPWEWRLADLPDPEPGAPTVFSTFACGGGSSMGYKRAGFNVLGCCEIDPRIAEIYRANLHPKLYYVEDIRDFCRRDDLPDELMHLDVLDGSPPCSTFSTAGNRDKDWGREKKFVEGQALQTLDDLFFVFLDLVEKLRPRVFVAENVTGLLGGKARGYVAEIVSRSRALGYSVQAFKLNASRMGVPQERERVFFIANRCGFDPLRMRFDEPPIVFGEVKRGSGKPCTAYARDLIENWRMAGEYSLKQATIKKYGRNANFNTYTIEDGMVCKTLTASGSFLRVPECTRFTNEDYRNVSTFPQDYDFRGKVPHFMCGMSVPPSMMANVAHEIRAQWLGGGGQ